MRFAQLDVFAEAPYSGNPLAVFPEAAGLTEDAMQAIAREMNLSESTFVTATEPNSYTVRIFTPQEELPFAGHPTLGTCWLLRRLGLVTAERATQSSAAGGTLVSSRGDEMWFERPGTVGDPDPVDVAELAAALSLSPDDIGFDGAELGGGGSLMPRYANAAGFDQLMVPVASVEVLGRCHVDSARLTAVAGSGAYCVAPAGEGHLRARGFWPGVGVAEDPGTGSAAGALGIYLADALGPIEVEIDQGVEIRRPSHILLRAEPGRVHVGGRCRLVFEGELKALPVTSDS